MILVNSLEMRKLDSAAVEIGIDASVLMENAAASLAREILKESPETVLIFTGKGQNGGDGFACARHLFNKGINVEIVMLAPPEALSGSALNNYEICAAIGIKMSHFLSGEKYSADVIADCILGTGFSGELTGDYASAARAINKSGAFVISADIPSGVSADNGKTGTVCVRADKTVTFGFPKHGLYSPLSADHVGEVVISDISIPRNLPLISRINSYLLTADDIHIPTSSKAAHKGTNGRVAVAGGSDGKLGAVLLSQDAALHSGAGLVTCLVPERLTRLLMTQIKCSMCSPLEETDFSAFESVLIGNGLGTSSGAYAILRKAVGTARKTLVIDADGLNLLSNDPDILTGKSCEVILTPHPLEFSRLCGAEKSEVIENRTELASEFAAKYKVTLVLKGAHTVVALPDGATYTNTTGNEGMAKGGSGDVLAGLIAGIAPRYGTASDAALAGVYLHGLAGDIAAREKGKLPMTAQDIADSIPKAFEKIVLNP